MNDLEATVRQLKHIESLESELGIGDDDGSDLCFTLYGQTPGGLSRSNASAYIEVLRTKYISRFPEYVVGDS